MVCFFLFFVGGVLFYFLKNRNKTKTKLTVSAIQLSLLTIVIVWNSLKSLQTKFLDLSTMMLFSWGRHAGDRSIPDR